MGGLPLLHEGRTRSVRYFMTHRHIPSLTIYAAALVLAVSLPLSAEGSSCTAEHILPDNEKQIGVGTASAEYDGVTTVKGDQKIYIKLKNVNVLGVAYSLSIATNSTPENEICTYQALLPPQTSAILSGALFAEPPIGWKVTVSVQSDAGVISYSLYSLSGSAATSLKKQKSTKDK